MMLPVLGAIAGVKRLALPHLIPSDDPDYSEADWRAAVADITDVEIIVGHDGLRVRL